jgi:tetratricopeptide (TPR) repeat protein
VNIAASVRRPAPPSGRGLRGLLGGLLLLLGLAAAWGIPAAQAAQVRAAPHDGYGRLVFDWAAPVRWQAEVAAGNLILQFSAPVTDDPAGAVAPLKDYVSAVRLSEDRRTVTLPLTGQIDVNAFTLGSAVVIDFHKPDSGAPAAQAAPAPTVPSPAAPSPRPAPTLGVRTGSHPGFERLVFDWPRSVGYRVDQADRRARITFERPAEIDLGALRTALPAALSAVTAQSTDTALSVSVPVPEGGRVRHFTSGPKVVLDILLPDGTVEAAAAPDPQPRPAEPARPSPPAPAPAAAPPVAAPAVPAGPPPAQAPDSALNAGAQALAEQMRERLGRPAPPPAEPPPEAATEDPAAATAAAAGRRSLVASLAFPWDKPTAAAVFRRAGYLWVVFDRYTEVDLSLLRRLGRGVVHHIEQRQSRTATVVRMIVEPGYAPSVRREGLLWIVDLMRQPYRPAHPIEVTPQAQSPVGPRLFLPVSEGGRAMVLEDPEVGDRFIVVPVIPLGSGVYPAHAYPDADLPVTAQGILIAPHTDDIVVNSTRNGVDVTAPGGLTFSPDLQEMKAMANVGTDTNLTRVLDIGQWMRGPEDEYWDNKTLLQQAVANAPAGRRTNARIDLARFYFAHGYGAEALGVLKVLEDEAPEMVNTSAFRALRGAASFLMGRYADAVADLGHPSLGGVEEATFWRAAAQAELGDPALQALTLRDFGGVIGTYPRRVKVPLALIGAKAAVAAADDLGANNFLTAARVQDNTPHEMAAITYLEGKLAEATGNYDTALEHWAELEDSTDRYYRAVATRDRVELLYALEQLDRENLIRGLERLRFAWRGGDFEFGLLMRLGGLYTEAEDFGKALRVWQQAATYFQDRPDAEVALDRMHETFRKLFYEGYADTIPAVKAIALYDEFRELTPTGPEGDEMIRRLADRLVSVDLLSEAARLLKRQIDYRLNGADKARVGARLGLVYLLDRRPGDAMQALLDSKSPNLPPSLDRQRTHLLSRALADLGKVDEAVDLLKGDDSRAAAMLRAETYWKNGQWAAAATALAALAPEPSRTLVLTDDEARMVLDWATALTLAQDERGVAAVRRRYMQAMERTPFRDAFDLITTIPEDGVIDYRTVAERIKQAEDFKSFLAAYRDRLRTEGLSAIN